MVRVELSVAARRDLDEIRTYGCERFGVDATIEHLEGFERVFALLSEHPLAGQDQPHHGDGIRPFAVRPHRIFYRATTDEALIVRILHHAQEARARLRDDA